MIAPIILGAIKEEKNDPHTVSKFNYFIKCFSIDELLPLAFSYTEKTCLQLLEIKPELVSLTQCWKPSIKHLTFNFLLEH
ncbi:MAG: hypothetical protein ACPLSN_06650 [Dictyoglomus turgidum]